MNDPRLLGVQTQPEGVQDRRRLLAGLLGLPVRASEALRRLVGRSGAHLLGVMRGSRTHLFGLRLRLPACPLGLCVYRTYRCDSLVPRGLRLRTGVAEDLLGLLLRCAHAVRGPTVGLGDPLARANLGLLAKLQRGAFSRLHDSRHAGRRVVSRARQIIAELFRRRGLRLHPAMVDPPRYAASGRDTPLRWQETLERCPCGQSGCGS